MDAGPTRNESKDLCWDELVREDQSGGLEIMVGGEGEEGWRAGAGAGEDEERFVIWTCRVEIGGERGLVGGEEGGDCGGAQSREIRERVVFADLGEPTEAAGPVGGRERGGGRRCKVVEWRRLGRWVGV